MLAWTLALIGLILLIIFTGKKKFNKKWLKVLLIILEIILGLYLAFRILVPLSPAPEPKGPQEVQADMVYYSHKTAYPKMATDGDLREIPVHVYAPKDLKEKSHPLFIFSHGSFGVGTSNETLFLELASRGYIVMSLDHPHHAFFSTLSSGETIYVDQGFFKEVMASQGSEDLGGTLESLNHWVDPRIEDLNFVLDKILDDKEDNIYEGKIDQERIILSGHSLGGSAVLALGRQRPEDIQGLVVLEAPFVKDIIGIENNEYIFVDDKYPRPILHVYSDSLWGRMEKITTYAENQKLIDLKDPAFVNEHLEGVGHIGLTDMALVSPIITKQIDGGLDKRRAPETLLELNEMVLEFLQGENFR